MIDWNVYARLGELCLKLTEARENLSVHLLIDCSASMDWGRPNKLLYAKRVAAALGALALASYDTVYLGVFSDDVHAVFPPLRGRDAVGHAARTPARPDARACDRPGAGRRRPTAAIRGRDGVAVLITDFLVADGYGEALSYLARAGPADHGAAYRRRPGGAAAAWTACSSCTTARPANWSRWASHRSLLRRYQGHFGPGRRRSPSACRSQRAHYVRVSTAVPPQTLVLQTLRRDGILR